MLTALRRGARAMEPLAPATAELGPDILWLDLHAPTGEELRLVERVVGVVPPTPEEMQEIEASARAYEEAGAVVLTATVLVHADTPPPDTTEITFILKGEMLVTLRYADPQPFRSIGSRLERAGGQLGSSLGVFFWLMDQVISRAADILERCSLDVDELSARIFAQPKQRRGEGPDLLDAIGRIGRNGDTISKVRESLHTLQRVLLAVGTTESLPQPLKKESRARAKALNRDVHSVMEHSGFVTSNVNLLLNATMGLINIEQTNIIKLFSVLAIVFLPPTLIASIYGMNFDVMPELHWRFGYPFALILMILSAVLPYTFFKRKRWL